MRAIFQILILLVSSTFVVGNVYAQEKENSITKKDVVKKNGTAGVYIKDTSNDTPLLYIIDGVQVLPNKVSQRRDYELAPKQSTLNGTPANFSNQEREK